MAVLIQRILSNTARIVRPPIQKAHIHLFDSASTVPNQLGQGAASCRSTLLASGRRAQDKTASAHVHSSVSQDFDALLSPSFSALAASSTTSTQQLQQAAVPATAEAEARCRLALKQAMVVSKKAAGLRDGMRLDMGVKELARLGLFGGAQGRVYELAL